jgi:DNA-binding HxlR family transcriptional regulator
MDMGSAEGEAIAEGLWRRLRDVALTAHRLEQFTFTPEARGLGPTGGELAALAADERALATVARDLVLRAFGALSDAVNFRILSGLGGAAPVLMADLARAVGLPPLALAERVNDLVRVGLVTRVLERDAVERTTAGQGCVAVVEAVAASLGAKCREGLPPLLGR